LRAGTVSMNGQPLPVIAWQESKIVVGLSKETPAGTYLLVVSRGIGAAQWDALAVTIVGAGGRGEKGDKGERGDPGPQGPAGPAGAVGPQGLQGPQGPQGATGAIGPQGPQGPVGPQGPTGPIGPTGPMGPMGPQGLKGDPGTSALNGQACAKGLVRGFSADGALICETAEDLFPKLALCGVSARDVSTFVTPGSVLTVTNSCTPTANTQAMLVTRSGHEQIDPTVLQNYLNDGGIVITAVGSSFAMYNKLLGSSVAQPSDLVGSCNDNVNPIVQMNDGDVFWQSNPFVQETLGGCGYDLAALWPDITPLGGATELGDTISLGYMSVGKGRLWLVESDWPDGQTTFTDQSLRLMRYMVRTR
jgi:hypothetical protein